MTAKDDRFFVRVALDLPGNLKLAGAPAATKWLNVCGFIVARRDLTDGVVRPAVVAAEADVPTKHVRDLVTRGVWHEPGHTCDRCDQPPVGHVVIHDYLQHQQSRDEIAETRRAKSEAGRRGAAARWGSTTNGTSHSTSHASSHGTSQDDRRCGSDATDMAEQSRGEKNPVVQSVSDAPPRLRAVENPTDGLDYDRIATATGAPARSGHAHTTAKMILQRAPEWPRNPTAYVLAAIRQDPDSYRWHRGNPTRAQECPTHQGEWADACRGCAIDRRVGSA